MRALTNLLPLCCMEGTKKDVFQIFKKRYKKAKLMAIGDGKTEAEAAKTMRIPFFQISAQKGTEAAVADLKLLTEKFAQMQK